MTWICENCDVMGIFEPGVMKICIHCGGHMKPYIKETGDESD